MFGCLSRKLKLEAYLMLSLRLVITWWSDRAELQLRAGMGACLCSPSAYSRSFTIDNFMEICSVGAARCSLQRSELCKRHGKKNTKRRMKFRRKLIHGVFLWARFCLIKVTKRNVFSPVDGGARSGVGITQGNIHNLKNVLALWVLVWVFEVRRMGGREG